MKKILISAYALFLLFFSFFSYLFIDRNLSYLSRFYTGFATNNREITAVIYINFVVVLFAFYFVFLKMYLKNKLNRKDIVWIIILSCLTLMFFYPAMLSFDIFNYVLTAKVAFFYHENPYIIMPIQFLGDPLLAFTHAANKIALYGPFWIGITGLPYILGFGNFLITIFNFKLLATLFYLATSWMIYKISKDFLSVTIFSLNPLVIIETLVSGHNDIVMIFFVLCGVFFLSRNKMFPSFLFLLLSILIKYSTLLLLPVFLYVSFLQRNKKNVNWDKIYSLCAILMMIAFLLSPLREEIYPWYVIWFLSFAALSPKNKLVLYISLAFSFSSLFRYVPFILLGTHLAPTPFIKTFTTFAPVILVTVYVIVKEKLWEKRF